MSLFLYSKCDVIFLLVLRRLIDTTELRELFLMDTGIRVDCVSGNVKLV